MEDKQSKMETNCDIITSINLRPCTKYNFSTRPQEENNVQKMPNLKNSSINLFRRNLKSALVIEAKEPPNEESVEFIPEISKNKIEITPESVSAINNRSFDDSYLFDASRISELNITDSESMQYDVEFNTPELNNQNVGNLPQFYCLRNKVLVILKPETVFWFCGKLKVRVLYGAIKMFGTAFNSSETLQVYSPRSHSLVGIESEFNTSNCDKSKLWKTLDAEGVNRNLKSSLALTINQCQSGWAVALLENLTNHLTNFLSAYCSFKLFPKIEDQTFYAWNEVKRAEAILQANLRFCKSGKQLTINPSWKIQIVDKILDEYSCEQQSINLVFGGKSVGKSTFSSYLVNTTLSKIGTVVFINLDPGQTECTPSGCISLNLIDKPFLGPNFTQLRTPYYQLYIGDINVANCVTRYLDAVKMLVDRLRSDPKLSKLPVIVNTMGFCKGIGWDIAVSIIRLFEPTNVVQIKSNKPKNNFDKLLTTDIIAKEVSWIPRKKSERKTRLLYTFHQISSEAEIQGNGETFNVEPYQKRDIVMLAYLSQITKTNQSNKTLKSTIQSINDTLPYKVPLSSLYLSLTQTGVPLTHVLAAMNGNIVALCGYDPTVESNNSSDVSSSENLQVLIRSPLSTCYGFGIVRGIDSEKKFLYINTPLTLKELKFVNCLVDCLPIPTALLPLNLPNAPYTGNKADLPTSKEARRGYFRVRPQTSQT